MGDYINSLPTDDEPLNSKEQEFLDSLFRNDSTTFQKLVNELREPLVAGILFLLLNVPQVTEFLKTTVPYANSSETSLLCFKTLLFVILLLLYNNSDLIFRK